MVLEKKVVLWVPNFKSVASKDPLGMANLDPRGILAGLMLKKCCFFIFNGRVRGIAKLDKMTI